MDKAHLMVNSIFTKYHGKKSTMRAKVPAKQAHHGNIGEISVFQMERMFLLIERIEAAG